MGYKICLLEIKGHNFRMSSETLSLQTKGQSHFSTK
uniref:Uncharacterized protein n=1 Tax=Rhizophora mucronata TaxID=61149 RepID=A0A2P2KVS6_RHIMU